MNRERRGTRRKVLRRLRLFAFFGGVLLAGAFEADHGGGTGGPVFKGALGNHLVHQLADFHLLHVGQEGVDARGGDGDDGWRGDLDADRFRIVAEGPANDGTFQQKARQGAEANPGSMHHYQTFNVTETMLAMGRQREVLDTVPMFS